MGLACLRRDVTRHSHSVGGVAAPATSSRNTLTLSKQTLCASLKSTVSACQANKGDHICCRGNSWGKAKQAASTRADSRPCVVACCRNWTTASKQSVRGKHAHALPTQTKHRQRRRRQRQPHQPLQRSHTWICKHHRQTTAARQFLHHTLLRGRSEQKQQVYTPSAAHHSLRHRTAAALTTQRNSSAEVAALAKYTPDAAPVGGLRLQEVPYVVCCQLLV
jgi:hypothetical protein